MISGAQMSMPPSPRSCPRGERVRVRGDLLAKSPVLLDIQKKNLDNLTLITADLL